MLGAGEVLQDIAFVVLVLLGFGCIIAVVAAVAFIRELLSPVGDKSPRDKQNPHPHLILVVSDHAVTP